MAPTQLSDEGEAPAFLLGQPSQENKGILSQPDAEGTPPDDPTNSGVIPPHPPDPVTDPPSPEPIPRGGTETIAKEPTNNPPDANSLAPGNPPTPFVIRPDAGADLPNFPRKQMGGWMLSSVTIPIIMMGVTWATGFRQLDLEVPLEAHGHDCPLTLPGAQW